MPAPRRVLVICTANACRSPVAERALQRAWRSAGADVDVRSAGVSGGGIVVPPPTVEAAAIANIDLSRHRSRRLTADLVRDEGADLVLGMTREHVRAAVGFDPDSFGRAFTLRELVRRTDLLTEPPTDWESWLAAVGDGRSPADLVGPDVADDLPDPIGHPVAAHMLMVQEVTHLAHRLAAATP